MSYTLVQEAITGDTYDSATIAVTLDTPPVAGRLLVARVSWYDDEIATTTLTDTAGNIWREAHAPIHAYDDGEVGVHMLQVWYRHACLTADPLVVTATWGSSQSILRMAVSEWSGCSSTADPLGDTDTTTIPPDAALSAPYDYTAGTVTPSASGDLIYVALMTWVLDSGPPDATALDPVDARLLGYYATATGAAYAADISFTENPDIFLGSVVVFRFEEVIWVPIADFEEHPLDAAQYPGGVARVVCDLWVDDTNAGSPPPTITARLVSLLETRDAEGLREVEAEVGRSATVQSAVPTDASFPATLTGIKLHRIEVTTNGTHETPMFCAPGAEVTR